MLFNLHPVNGEQVCNLVLFYLHPVNGEQVCNLVLFYLHPVNGEQVCNLVLFYLHPVNGEQVCNLVLFYLHPINGEWVRNLVPLNLAKKGRRYVGWNTHKTHTICLDFYSLPRNTHPTVLYNIPEQPSKSLRITYTQITQPTSLSMHHSSDFVSITSPQMLTTAS